MKTRVNYPCGFVASTILEDQSMNNKQNKQNTTQEKQNKQENQNKNCR